MVIVQTDHREWKTGPRQDRICPSYLNPFHDCPRSDWIQAFQRPFTQKVLKGTVQRDGSGLN